MEMSIAEYFFNQFIRVLGSSEYINRVEGHYNNSDNWTKLLLEIVDANGNHNFPALQEVLIKIAMRLRENEPSDSKSEYSVFSEYYRIDLILTKETWTGSKNNYRDYNWHPIICLEHENRANSWFSEVVKLSNISSRLHVVIGYTSIKNINIDIEKVDRLLRNQILNNRMQSNSEFLVILGLRNNDLGKIYKSAYDIINGYKGFLWRIDSDMVLKPVEYLTIKDDFVD